MGHRLRASADGLSSVPAVSLSLEPANISAIANDVGTEVIFLRQLIAQARPDDVAIGISTSGGSRNIIMALEEARKRNMLTVALLGYDGGEIKRRRLADFPIVVQCDYIPRIQEVQASIYHIIRETLGGTCAVAKLELFGTARCPHTQEMREWLEWQRSDFVEYDVEADAAARAPHARPGRRDSATFRVLVEDGKVVQIGWQGRSCMVDAE